MADAIDLLNAIAKKMNRIEEKDSDFRNNFRWNELKKQQDSLYIEVAKEKLNYLNSKNKAMLTEYEQRQIEFYIDFIEKGEKQK